MLRRRTGQLNDGTVPLAGEREHDSANISDKRAQPVTSGTGTGIDSGVPSKAHKKTFRLVATFVKAARRFQSA
jgi:hypothetical protein